MTKKILIATGALLAIIGGTSFALTKVYAQGHKGKFPPIVQTLVDRFNLNEDEVNEVMAKQRAQHQEEMRSQHEEMLTQAVADGKITEEQKALILAKIAEHEAEQGQNREEMQAWAEENGIDLSVFGRPGGFGPKGPKGPGQCPQTTE